MNWVLMVKQYQLNYYMKLVVTITYKQLKHKMNLVAMDRTYTAQILHELGPNSYISPAQILHELGSKWNKS